LENAKGRHVVHTFLSAIVATAALAGCVNIEDQAYPGPPLQPSQVSTIEMRYLSNNCENCVSVVATSVDGRSLKQSVDVVKVVPGKHVIHFYSTTMVGGRILESGNVDQTVELEAGAAYTVHGRLVKLPTINQVNGRIDARDPLIMGTLVVDVIKAK
jgi:hypothetical protein